VDGYVREYFDDVLRIYFGISILFMFMLTRSHNNIHGPSVAIVSPKEVWAGMVFVNKP
jgi:hypothetical protein